MQTGKNQVRKPNAETAAEAVPRKTAEDLGQEVDRVSPQSMNKVKKGHEDVSMKIQKSVQEAKSSGRKAVQNAENMIQQGKNKVKKGAEQVSEKVQKSAKDAKQAVSKKLEKQNKQNDDKDWSKDFKSAESEIKNQLKKGNKDLSSQLEKAYQGILKNCIKQAEDEPHKLQNCWNEFSKGMQPIYKNLSQRSAESAEALKKCFQSKKNAKECVRQGIDFGQKSLNDATNALKTYLA